MIRISIITPLHNKGPYIEATIQSVLAQEMAEWELIIVENGSTDEGPAIAARYAKRDRRVRCLVSARQGPGAARNTGLDHATGEWVLFLDADDLLASDYLAERLRSAQADPKVEIVAGPWTEFSDGEVGKPARTCFPAAYRRAPEVLAAEAVGSAPWVIHAAIVKRTVISRDRQWPEDLDRWPSEDAAFWFPLVMSATVTWAGGTGAAYRLSTPTSRDRRDDIARRTSGLLAVIEHNVRFLQADGRSATPEQATTLTRVLERAYIDCEQSGHTALAATTLKAANHWLGHCRATAPGLLARRLLGIPLFNRLSGRLN